jgi:hypothetical protein
VAYALVPTVNLTHDKVFVYLGRRVGGNDAHHPRGAWPALEPLSESQQLICIATGVRFDVTVRQVTYPPGNPQSSRFSARGKSKANALDVSGNSKTLARRHVSGRSLMASLQSTQ